MTLFTAKVVYEPRTRNLLNLRTHTSWRELLTPPSHTTISHRHIVYYLLPPSDLRRRRFGYLPSRSEINGRSVGLALLEPLRRTLLALERFGRTETRQHPLKGSMYPLKVLQLAAFLSHWGSLTIFPKHVAISQCKPVFWNLHIREAYISRRGLGEGLYFSGT